MNKYNHRDWKLLKRKYKLKNKDIARIIDLTPNSVTNLSAPKKELPTWAKAMIFIDELNTEKKENK